MNLIFFPYCKMMLWYLNSLVAFKCLFLIYLGKIAHNFNTYFHLSVYQAWHVNKCQLIGIIFTLQMWFKKTAAFIKARQYNEVPHGACACYSLFCFLSMLVCECYLCVRVRLFTLRQSCCEETKIPGVSLLGRIITSSSFFECGCRSIEYALTEHFAVLKEDHIRLE